ncbi:hypothetical protein TIFTF001_032062 [Ficus carica]|uniref:Uncharacterized protein n=1 Tax=Ficus carica TaxID=3494 RepID=A0AA88DXQ9_FICCA|nr:hypothetical protein TIFTF001_032062 [Ficus carica]
MMASKLPRVVPTCHKGGFGPWCELDWTDHPNHSMAARHVVLAERKLMSYVYVIAALTFQPTILDGMKERQEADASLLKTRNEVLEGKESDFNISDDGILYQKDRLCIPVICIML